MQPHAGQYFLDLVQRLAAEVRRAQHLRLGLLYQIADVDDVVVLQAVGRANRQFELVDLAQEVAVEREIVLRLFLADFARLFEVYEELQLVLQNAGGQRHGVRRRRRSVGLDRHRQPVIVGDLTDAAVLDLVGHALDRAEYRIDRYEADRRVLRTVAGGGDIALASRDHQLHGDRGTVIERADQVLGVHDLDVARQLDHARGDFARTDGAQVETLRAIALHLYGHRLDIEDDVDHILTSAGNRRELMQHVVDLDRRHCRALQRRQQHTTERIAERETEAALERLGDDRGDASGIDAGLGDKLLRLDQVLPVLLKHVGYLSRPVCSCGRGCP